MVRSFKRFGVVCFAVLLSVFAISARGSVPSHYIRHADHVRNEYIVALREVDESRVPEVARAIAAQYHLRLKSTFTRTIHGFHCEASHAQAVKLSRDERVAFVEENVRMPLAGNPEATLPSNTPLGPGNEGAWWGLDRISHRKPSGSVVNSVYGSGTYEYEGTGAGVRVYVVDTGVRGTHGEFRTSSSDATSRVIPGYKQGPAYPCGHGTAVASLIGGRTYGVAKGVTLVSVAAQVCDSNGATLAELVKGLEWISADYSLHSGDPAVVNCSFESSDGFELPDSVSSWSSAVNTLVRQGLVVVQAAGNHDKAICTYTSGSLSFSAGQESAVITVGGTSQPDKRWECDRDDTQCDLAFEQGSNYGSCVDIFAPATLTRAAESTSDTAMRTIEPSGTSFATPLVSGAIARLLAEDPSLRDSAHPEKTARNVWKRLMESATVGALDPSSLKPAGVTNNEQSPNRLLYVGGVTISRQPTWTPHPDGSVTLTVGVPRSTDSSLRYDWYGNADYDPAAPLNPDRTSPDYTFVPASGGGSYWVRVSRTVTIDGQTSTVSGDSRIVVVCAAPANVHASASATSVPSNTPVTLTATADGPNVTFTWFKGLRIEGLPAEPGEPTKIGTEQSLQITPAGQFDYWVRASSGSCSVDSNSVTISVCDPIHVSTSWDSNPEVPYNTSDNLGTTEIRPLPVATATGSVASYQWYQWLNYSWTHPEFNTEQNRLAVPLRLPDDDQTAYWMTNTLHMSWPSIDSVYFVRATGCNGYVDSVPMLVRICRLAGFYVVDPFAAPPNMNTNTSTIQVPDGGHIRLQAAAIGDDLKPIEQTLYAYDPAWYSWSENGTTLGHGRTYLYTPSGSAEHVVTATFNQKPGCSQRGIPPTYRIVKASCALVSSLPPKVTTALHNETKPLTVTPQAGATITKYEWYQGTFENATRMTIDGAQSPITDQSNSIQARPGFTYWVRVKGMCGDQQVLEDSELLTVSCIDCHPRAVRGFITHNGQAITEPVSVSAGQSYTLDAPSVSAGLTYQWFAGAAYDDAATPLSTSSEIDPQPAATTTYWVRTTDPATGDVSDSYAVTLIVNHPAVSPVTVTIDPGTVVPYQSIVRMTASTSALTGTLTYEWHHGAAPSDVLWRDYVYAFVALADDTYWVTVTGTDPATGQPRTLESDHIDLITTCSGFQPLVSIIPNPIGAHIANGNYAWLTALGTGKNLYYEWFEGAVGEYAFANSQAVMVTPVHDTVYWVRATDACGNHVTASITVYVCVPRIDVQPANTVIAPNGTATLSVHAIPAQAGQTLTYQWYSGISGQIVFPVAGATSSQLNVPAASAGNYWVMVSGSCQDGQPAVYSATATVSVCSLPSITSATTQVNASFGELKTLSVNVSGSDLSYQWYQGASGDTSHPISNNDQPSLQYNTTADASFWVRVISQGVCTSDSPTMVVALCPAFATPGITADQTEVMPNSIVNLTAHASGFQPLTYQWYEGATVGDTTHPVGTDSASFTTPPLTASKSYWASVVHNGCIAYGDAITVSVCNPISVNWLAVGRSIHAGDPVTLAIGSDVSTADGAQLYWYQGVSGDVAHSQLIDGPVTNTTMVVSPTQTTSYWVRVKKGNCHGDSPALTLTVCLPRITVQPSSMTVELGQSASLSVAGDLPGLTVQWYIGASGDTSNAVPNATSTTFAPSPSTTTTYWARLTSSCGASADSSAATVTVHVCQPAAITTQPASITSIMRGQSVTVGVAATGDGLTFQWYQGTSGNTSTPLGSTAATLTLSPQNPTDYWVKVTGTCGSINSNTAHVSVCTTPVINTQPQNAYVFSGQTVTLSVSASEATTETMHYQWYTSSGTPVGSDSPSFTTPPVTGTAQYFVRVTAGSCSVDSNLATVGLCTLPQVINSGTTNNVAIGQSVSLTCVVSPGTGNTFSWYSGTVGDVAHSTLLQQGASNTLSITATASNGGTYWASISRSDDGCVSRTNAYTVNVCVPTITTQPAASTMINSGQSLTLTVAANTSGLTYQWYVGTSGTTTSPISGATGASVTVNPAVNTNYWVKVTGTCGQSVNSNTAAVTICQPPSITTQPPANSNIVRGQNVTLSVGAAGNGLTYQWYQGPSGNTSTPLGNTTATLSLAPLNPVDYWVKVSGTCGAVNSNTAHVAVCTTPVINTQPQSTSTFSGTSATLTVSASEATTETLHYQWYKNGTVAVGTDSPALNTGALTTDTNYFVRITAASGTCSVDSNTVTVSMCALPQTLSGAPNQNTTPGQTVRLQLGPISGATAYMWYSGASGNTSSPVTGWQAANYIDVSPSTTSSWWAQVQNGSCVSNTTTTTVNVCIPAITTQPQNMTIASGSTTLTVASNLPGSTYQWYVGTSGTTTSPISGATSASVTVTPGSTTSYWCKVTGTCGTSVNSNTATVTVCAVPSVTGPSNAPAVYRGYTSGLSVSATGTNLTYQWYIGNSGDTSNPISGATSAVYTTTVYNSEKYWVRVTGMCGTKDSAAAWISVNPVIVQQPVQTTYLSYGSRAMLSVNAQGTYLHYQWTYDSGQPVSGAPDAPVWITPDVTQSRSYYCHITSGYSGATDSYVASVNLCDGGNSAAAPFASSAGGSCRYLWSQANGNYDHIEWYQGQKGDTSYQIGNGYYLYTCSSVGTTVWYRVVGYDSNQGQSCYTDSPSMNVQ